MGQHDERNNVMLNLWMSKSMRQEIESAVFSQGHDGTRSAWIRQAIRERLARLEKRKAAK